MSAGGATAGTAQAVPSVRRRAAGWHPQSWQRCPRCPHGRRDTGREPGCSRGAASSRGQPGSPRHRGGPGGGGPDRARLKGGTGGAVEAQRAGTGRDRTLGSALPSGKLGLSFPARADPPVSPGGALGSRGGGSCAGWGLPRNLSALPRCKDGVLHLYQGHDDPLQPGHLCKCVPPCHLGLGSVGGGPGEPPEPGVGWVWLRSPAPPRSFLWALGWRVWAGGCRWHLQSPEGCAALWGQWLLHQLPLSLAVLLRPQNSGFAASLPGGSASLGEQPLCVPVPLGFLDVGNSEHMQALLPPRANGVELAGAALALQEPPGEGYGRIQPWEGGVQPPGSLC